VWWGKQGDREIRKGSGDISRNLEANDTLHGTQKVLIAGLPGRERNICTGLFFWHPRRK
jgi:hypothetical protein